jgi:hypothetical protein
VYLTEKPLNGARRTFMPNPNSKRHGRTVSSDEEGVIDLLDSKNINYIAVFRSGTHLYGFSYNGNDYSYNVDKKDVVKNEEVIGNGLAALTTELGG